MAFLRKGWGARCAPGVALAVDRIFGRPARRFNDVSGHEVASRPGASCRCWWCRSGVCGWLCCKGSCRCQWLCGPVGMGSCAHCAFAAKATLGPSGRAPSSRQGARFSHRKSPHPATVNTKVLAARALEAQRKNIMDWIVVGIVGLWLSKPTSNGRIML